MPGFEKAKEESRRGAGELEGRVAEDGVAGVSRAGEDGFCWLHGARVDGARVLALVKDGVGVQSCARARQRGGAGRDELLCGLRGAGG